jgi:RHS repeat-associated protein
MTSSAVHASEVRACAESHINGRAYAIHTDHLNTPRRLTNAQGQVAWQWLVTGFGEVQPTLGTKGYALSGIDNSRVYSEAVTFNLRYPGQQWDEETKLNYNLNRYYDARTGRYIQSDPIGLEGGWNRFGYVGGNPLLFIDPEGLMGGNGAAHRGRPSVAVFGCLGLACAGYGTQDSGTQVSAELTLGGGFEVCDSSPPPPPPPQTCSRTDGQAQPQPPGLPFPKRYGGAFIGPSIKSDGRFCIRIGPHATVPFTPSFDAATTPRMQ